MYAVRLVVYTYYDEKNVVVLFLSGLMLVSVLLICGRWLIVIGYTVC